MINDHYIFGFLLEMKHHFWSFIKKNVVRNLQSHKLSENVENVVDLYVDTSFGDVQ